MGLGDHLYNNVVVTNLLHMISNNDADSMQIVRILIGQLISFSLVMVYFRKTKKQHRVLPEPPKTLHENE